MSIDNGIVNEFDEVYQSAYLAWNPFYPLADIDLRMFLGDQWSEEEKRALLSEGRQTWVYNLIRKNINMIDGYQRSHRLSSVVLPQEEKDQQAADDLSDLLIYVMQAGDGYKVISDCFSGAIKTGWNLCTVWMDYRDDPINGDIKFGREPYSGFITDPYFTQMSLEDCSYVIRRKYVSPQQAASLLPGKEDEIYALHDQGWNRDDKFTWLPYQNQPNGQDFLAYNEYYKQGWKAVPLLVDTETGESSEWEGSKDALKFLLGKYPSLKIVNKQKKFIECHIIVNDVLMKTEENQFDLDEYPFVPFFGVFESECELWGLKLQSLTRSILDPQKQLNRNLSQMTDIMETNINSGWIAEEDSVINPQSLFQTAQGKVVWKKQGSQPGSLERIQPAQLPPSFFQLIETYSAGISEILGINDAAFGIPESGNDSGVLTMLRQGAAINNLQNVFDGLRSAQKLLSKKVLKLIQTWTPEKVERILGRKPSEQFYSKDFIKYDISIQEGPLTDTQKQMHFKQMVDIYQITGGAGTSPITPTMLAKAAPIQGKGEYLQQIEQNEQAQAQASQSQQQMQSQLMQSNLEYQKAGAIEKVAGAKERFTRAIANTGLETERSARAVDDRASAALDRVKAMKELATMDDDRLVKYLAIVKGMEQNAEDEENQIKRKDFMVAAVGNKIGDETDQLSTGMGAPQAP
jgi:hypothetical protein